MNSITKFLGLFVVAALFLVSCSKEPEQLLSSATDVMALKTLADVNIPQGEAYESRVAVPLERSTKEGSNHYVKGVIEYVVAGEVVASIDFGNGKEDFIAKKTANGKTTKVFLINGDINGNNSQRDSDDDDDDDDDYYGECDGDWDDEDWDDNDDDDMDDDDDDDMDNDDDDDDDMDDDDDDDYCECEDFKDMYEIVVLPLVECHDCNYIVEGSIEIYEGGEWIGTVDFGDGTCDNIATFETTDGIEEFDLEEWDF